MRPFRFLVFPLLACAVSASPQNLDRVKDRLGARLQELRAASGFPACNVAVVFSEGKYVAASVGYSNVEAEKPLGFADRMPSGSIGKTYVAAAALRLAAEGKLDLDARISGYLGKEHWFTGLPNASAITVRQLMNHTSGIPEHVLYPEFVEALKKDPDKRWTAEELLEFSLGKKPLFEAGKGWSYADTNYVVLGAILERIVGAPLFSHLRKTILEPLDLFATEPNESRVIPRVAMGYSMPNSPFGVSGPVIVDGKFFLNPQMEYAGGGFSSTALDLARWCHRLFAGDFVPDAQRKEMLAGVEARTGPGDKYGLGVQIRKSDWGETLGHGGWFPGYLSEMAYFPDLKASIAFQVNTDEMRKLGMRPYRFLLELAKVVAEAKE